MQKTNFDTHDCMRDVDHSIWCCRYRKFDGKYYKTDYNLIVQLLRVVARVHGSCNSTDVQFTN